MSTSAVTVDAAGRIDDVTVQVRLRSVSDRSTTVVVQGYVAPIDPNCVRPVKELRTWTKVVIPSGVDALATLTFGADAFQRWDPATDALGRRTRRLRHRARRVGGVRAFPPADHRFLNRTIS